MAVHGTCDPAFEAVAETFRRSVASGEERGAICLRLEGREVLNFWGGDADPGKSSPWRENTLACCFSVTKGVFALLAHRLIDTGQLDPDAPVASLWRGFEAAGKGEITVFDVLTHRAGLPAVEGPVPEGLLYDRDGMESALAASAHVIPPKAAPVYHNMTYGYLLGGVIARAVGAPVETVLRDEITELLDADFTIGLSEADQARAARLSQDDPRALFAALDEAPETLFARSMAFFARDEDFNTARWRSAVIGSGSGHATARGIALIYEQFIRGRLLSSERRAALRRPAYESDGDDPILSMPIRYGEGVELSTPPALDFGPNPATLGYWGAGGAQGFADPDAELAFGYVTSRMDAALGSSARARALVAATYACL